MPQAQSQGELIMTISVKSFPIGETDFETIVNDGKIYIDKTSYLENLLTTCSVTLLLRPRRFGKTLSLRMLASFLEMNYENPEDRSRQENLFKDLKVYKENRKLCDEYMGRYPVISLSLKDTEAKNFKGAVYGIISIFADLAYKFRFLTRIESLDTIFLQRIINCKNNIEPVFESDGSIIENTAAMIQNFLKDLAACLHQVYGKKAVVIIDEYDVPLQKATVHGYYDSMLILIRGIMSTTLKDDQNIFKGYVTGCLRIAHQSIFTGVNNFKTFGIGDEAYSDFIGLTKDETAKLLKDCGMENRLPDVISWYDGYNLAGNEMLCPWSVLKFLSRALAEGNDPATFQPENYWANSSGNDIIEISMKHATPGIASRLQNLIDGGTEEIDLCEFTSYPEITGNTDFNVFATLMLHTGYFTAVRDNAPALPGAVTIKIPNREVLECFKHKVRTVFGRRNPEWLKKSQDLLNALFEGEAKKAAAIIRSMLLTFLSVRDTAYESVYHSFLLGILGIAADIAGADIKSNSECGDGFSDIVLQDDGRGIAVIIEFKKSSSRSRDEWHRLCETAISQIDSQSYDFDLRNDYDIVRKYGIVFYGKNCEAVHREYRREE